jgi:hypothetical protein
VNVAEWHGCLSTAVLRTGGGRGGRGVRGVVAAPSSCMFVAGLGVVAWVE